MTYDGNKIVNTNKSSLIAAPLQTSYADQAAFATNVLLVNTPPDKRHYSFIAGNYVYLLQGSSQTTRGFNVYKAPLTDPTNFSKTGNQILSNTGVSTFNITLLTVGDNIYIYGLNGNTSIYRASVANPEVWSKMTDVLPFAVKDSNAAVIGSTIYIFGDGTTGANSQKILTASTAAPTVFTDSGSTLPAVNSKMCLAITPTTLFLYGGDNGAVNSDVYSAPISTPLVWTNVGPATGVTNLYSRSCYVSSSYIYFIGGFPNSNNIARSPIADGINFTVLYGFGLKAQTTVQAINGRLYVWGGSTSSNMTETNIAALDANASNPWINTTYLPPNSGWWGYAGIGIDNYFYMYGGANTIPTISNPINRVAMHTPTATSRGPTNWDTTITGSTLPITWVGGYATRIDDTIYLFGGYSSGLTTKVLTATVADPTTVTQLSATGGPLSSHGGCFIAGGYIYTIGGDDEGNITNGNIYKAPITNPTQFVLNPSSFPVNKTRFNLAVIGGYVYTFGGSATTAAGVPGAATTDVYRCPLSELNQTGSTPWVTVTALPTATLDAVMVISGGYLFLIGGCSSAYVSIATVQCCSMLELANGISNFKSLGNFASAQVVSGSRAIYSHGDFYMMSGRNASTTSAGTTLYRTEARGLMKAINDVLESAESSLGIDLDTGLISSYNSYMQTGNFPWHVAKTT